MQRGLAMRVGERFKRAGDVRSFVDPTTARRFLDRLGFGEAPAISLDGLAKLQEAHLLAVCVTNWRLDRRVLSVDGEPQARRLAEPGTGGHPVELHVAFVWLLRALGFDATLAADADGAPVALVNLDGETLTVDVARPARSRAPTGAVGDTPQAAEEFLPIIEADAKRWSGGLRAIRATPDGWQAIHGKMHQWKGAEGESEEQLLGWQLKEMMRDTMGVSDVD